jgi:leucyl/phenylalanyl-tRNA--protein transferase
MNSQVTPTIPVLLTQTASYTALPHPDLALKEPDGLLAIGGQLSVPWLCHAYGQATFPWFGDDQPILWWSPSVRAILTHERLRQRRSMKRALQQSAFELRINHDFAQTITHCRDAHAAQGVWITEQMRRAYIALHEAGFAHSVEVYLHDQLVGGLYGVKIGRVFFAESMFHRVPNASKIALGHALLPDSLHIEWLEAQFMTPHLASLGAFTVTRAELLSKINA